MISTHPLGRNRVIRILVIAGSLFALWLLMSGLFKPLLVFFGVVSSLLCVWALKRLGIPGQERPFFSELRFGAFCQYLFWLIVEIGKADWAVTKVILSPESAERQHLIAVPATQRSDLGKALFANSITITPGTLTVETEDDHFIVHALNDEAADKAALTAMGERVTALQTKLAGDR